MPTGAICLLFLVLLDQFRYRGPMDEMLTTLRLSLSGRYRVDEELGRGGMAIVYLAHDLRHDRRVAIKVLRQDIGVSGAGDRFVREIRTAAQLSHPHILPLYDSGMLSPDRGERAAFGNEPFLFYVMPYVEGETIREHLERRGPFAVDEAVRIACEVADALQFAHDRGVVHRDIKPENIFLSAGHALVGDFGIARAADAAGLRFTTLTETGLAVGTPAYMSPEQATADPRIDGRSDQYALGCVLYEMLAGTPPFTGPTSQAIMARHTSDPVPRLATLRVVSQALEGTIGRSLAKVPADRWPSARSFAESLQSSASLGRIEHLAPATRRRLWPVVLAATVVLAAIAWVVKSSRVSGVTSDRTVSLAVLPFASQDTSQSALAGGLEEGVSTRLVKVVGLGVLSGGRFGIYRGKAYDPGEVAKSLGVDLVLVANVRASGNVVRVTPQLIDAHTGRTLWQQAFSGEWSVEGQVRDPFSMEDAIASAITTALEPQLGKRAISAQRSHAVDTLTYRLYLRARQEIRERTAASLDRATALLDTVIARDSTFTDAWMAMADALAWKAFGFGNARPADVSIAWRIALEHAIALDSLRPDAHSLRGLLRSAYEWDLAGARRDMQRAVRLAPAAASIASDYSGLLAMLSEHDSALHYARRGVRLDPNNAFTWSQLGNRFAFANMRDSALMAGERAVALDSMYLPSYWLLFNGYFDAGRREAADSAARRMLRLGGGNAPWALSLVAGYYRRSGNRAGTLDILNRVLALTKTQYVPPSTLGATLLAAGDRAGALAALKESVENHDISLRNDFMLSFGPAQGDPTYEEVKRRIFPNVSASKHPFQ